MIRASWHTRIARPVEEVFDYLADLDNEPRWNPDASNVVRTSPGPIGLGAVWEEDIRRVGHYVTSIDGYERPAALSFDARNSRTDARVRFELSPDGPGAANVACVVELTMKGGMRVVEPLLRSLIRRRIEQERPAALQRALAR